MSRLRIGFLGVGWIGRHRMEAMLEGGAVEACAICDPASEMIDAARRLAPHAEVVASLDDLLAFNPDGVVIATPSALHAEQAIRCLERRAAVFCQKPLGRNGQEVARVVAAARRADRLLAVDFSYRRTQAAREIVSLVRTGALGRLFAIDLTFHNAYGPDKPWFYDRVQSGGGCLMDLGSHLVDLAYWMTGNVLPAVHVSATCLSRGTLLQQGSAEVEDYAAASFLLPEDVVVRLACSWRLHAGVDAAIEAKFYGTEGGVALQNVAGSFYDFEVVRFTGTSRETIVSPPDAWGARAAQDWAERASLDLSFSADADAYIAVAETLDRIYEAATDRYSRSSPGPGLC